MRCDIQSLSGESFVVDLDIEGTRAATTLLVNGVPCHFERLSVVEAQRYALDDDPGYVPQTDAAGFCYVLVPYSRS